MSSSIKRRTAHISLATSCDRVRAEAAVAQDKIRFLKQLVRDLYLELDTLTKFPTFAVEHGIDFYTEVNQFEIEMIKQALRFTEGHQVRAAKLLNLNSTTLCAMIKRHNIQFPGLSS